MFLLFCKQDFQKVFPTGTSNFEKLLDNKTSNISNWDIKL